VFNGADVVLVHTWYIDISFRWRQTFQNNHWTCLWTYKTECLKNIAKPVLWRHLHIWDACRNQQRLLSKTSNGLNR